MKPTTFQLVADLLEAEEHLRLMNVDDLRREELLLTIDMLYEMIANKFDDAVYIIQTLEAQKNIFQNIKNQADARKKSVDGSIDRIKKNFMRLSELNPEVLQGELYKGIITRRIGTKSVEKEDVPTEYRVVIPEDYRIDKIKLNKIGSDVWKKHGRFPKIKGVEFKVGESLSFRQTKEQKDESSS